jgi:hypothetical protein
MLDDVTAVFECTLHTALSQELEIASLSCIVTMAWLWQNNDLWEPGRSHRLETHPVKEHSFVGNTDCSSALHIRAKNTAIFQLTNHIPTSRSRSAVHTVHLAGPAAGHHFLFHAAGQRAAALDTCKSCWTLQ